MNAQDIISKYDQLMTQLSQAVKEADWERLEKLQNSIDAVQNRFDHLPDSEKHHADIQSWLRRLLDRHQSLVRQVSQAKEEAAHNLRKLKLAKTQQQGYQPTESASIPPVYVDRKK